jgi:hypothetical protein
MRTARPRSNLFAIARATKAVSSVPLCLGSLLCDLAVTVPRERFRGRPMLAAASSQPDLDGLPSFHLLLAEKPRPGAVFFGGIVSLLLLGSSPHICSTPSICTIQDSLPRSNPGRTRRFRETNSPTRRRTFSPQAPPFPPPSVHLRSENAEAGGDRRRNHARQRACRRLTSDRRSFRNWHS